MASFLYIIFGILCLFFQIFGVQATTSLADESKECQEGLGMQSGAITKSQLSASTQSDVICEANQGRLHLTDGTNGKQGSWCGRRNDPTPWLQIDLLKDLTVTGVATQGRHGRNDQWVTEYKLQYSYDGTNFQYYKEFGRNTDKTFVGNTDPNTVVYHGLSPPIIARYVRFRPTKWQDNPSMRVELYGCQAFLFYKCNSTSFTLRYGVQSLPQNPCRGCLVNETKLPICQRRLYAPMASCSPQSYRISFGLKKWPSGELPDNLSAGISKNKPDYDVLTMQPSKRALVVDISEVHFVQYTGFAFTWSSNSSYTLNFTVDYSIDGIHWINYIEDERVKVFQVHWYHPSVCLCRKVLARFLRIKLTEESNYGLGLDGYLDVSVCPTAGADESEECQGSLGMQSGAIKRNQIRASSEYSSRCEANQGRLHLTDGTNSKQGAWCAGGGDETPWLQIDLLKDLAVTGVATQGRNGNDQWVTEYKLQYSYDGTNFQYYKEGGRNTDKTFVGNTDRDTVVYHGLNPPIIARYIRFRPTDWKVHPSMRVELYGCKGEPSMCGIRMRYAAALCAMRKKFVSNVDVSMSAAMNYTRLYLGCHFVNKSEAGLLSSGLAGYTEIDERVCIRTCSKLGYSYAVIQSGLLCFCTNSFSSNATANQTDCVLPFFSGKWYFNEVTMRFYRVPTENLKVEKVSISHHRRRIGAGFNITASVNIKDMGLARLTVDPGDGNELVFCDSPMTHFYKNPGIYRLFLIVEDIKGNKLNFTDSIEIADNLTKLDVECPRAVPQGHKAECNIKLARALNVIGKLSVESKEITLQQIPDSRISSFGVNVPRHVPATSTMFDKLLNKGERMYILTKYRVQEEGYLAGLEFNVAQSGPIHIKVLRQVVDVQSPVYPSESGIICTGLQRLFMDFGYCCSSSCEPMGNNLGMPASPKFVIVSDVILAQHMCEGYHFIDFTNVTQIKVLPGDMLGWYSSSRTGKIAVVEEGSQEQCLVYENVGDGGMAGQIFNESLQKSVSTMIFALSANVVPQSFSKASFNLERVARHKAVVELRDNFGNRAEMSNENIVCQRAVAGLSIEVPEVALVGEVVLGLNVTNGTNVTFIIHSGDGKVIHQSENSVKLNYTSTGVRDITVMAFNDVSAAIGECKGPVMLRGIKNVSILLVNPVATNDTFTLTIIISQGSSVDLNVSLGDESPGFNVSKFDVNDTFVVAKNHSYRRDGVYCVKALAKNSLTNASSEINITVQTSIAGLQVIAPQTVHSSNDDLVINISITQGTDVQYNVTLQNETKTANGLSVTVVFSKERLRPGLALLQVKAYNMLSSSQILIYIPIETPISGAWLKLVSPTRAVEAEKIIRFEFYYDTGSSVNMTFWKSIDEEGVPIILKQEKLVLSYEHVKYSNPGVFIARVNYSNALGWFVDERTVIVQHPVKDIDIITNSPTPLPPGIVNITVKQSGTIATNATLICSYGDGTASESLDFTGELNVSHRYTVAGDYKIVMNISNLATALLKEVTVNIVKTITLMIINAKSSASNLLSRSPSVHNTFPLESSVLFEAEHDGNVDIRHFTFTFGDGSHMNGTSDHIIGEHTYISKGEFNVTLRVTHQFGDSWNFTVVTLKESIAGLKISDDAPTVLSESTKFTINMDKLGTDTLIEINLGDGQKILFGDNNSDVVMSTADVRPVQASTKSITFLHTYKDMGLYDVKVHGWNDVSSMKLSHRTVTVKERCRYPDPQILSVGTNLSTALNVTNDKEIVIYARTKINCQASYKTIFGWKLEHYDFPVKVETELNKPSLTIPSRSLPYGIIILRFTAKMKYIIDGIESQAVGFINVIPVALKAMLVGGEFRKVSSKRWFRIDGSVSEDPDVERGNLTGIRFYWYCRRVNETFPLRVDDLPSVTLKDISLHSRNRGCEGSGARRLNYSTPDLKIGPGMLREDEMYVVKLVIRKDSREAFFEQTLKVLGKVLPDIAIKCQVNCDYKVNINNQLSVRSICANCEQENFTSMSYKWELYVRDELTRNWTLDLDLDSKAMTNTSEKNLVLRKNCLDVGRKYRLIFRAENEEGQQGQSEHYFKTNFPPRNGSCTISPREGRVLETYFHIKCPGWHDEDGPVMYKVFRGRKLLQHGKEAFLSHSLLPLGPRQNNYTYYLTVRIFDKFNSFSEEMLSVTVSEATMSRQDLKSTMAEDGLLTNMRISGDIQGVSQLIMSLSLVLDTQAAEEKGNKSSNTGGGEKLSEAKKERMEMKENLLEALVQLDPESLDTLGVMLEAMTSLTDDVTELSSTAQSRMMSALTKTVATLSAKKNADSLEALTSVSDGVMANLGNLFGSSKYRHDRNILQMAELKDEKQSETSDREMASLHQESEELNENARTMTKSAMTLLDDILDMIVEYQVTGQEPLLLQSERMAALVMKADTKDLAGSSVSIGAGSFALPSTEKVAGTLEDKDCFIVAKGLNAKDNPFIWNNSSSGVDSNCLGLKFQDCHGTPINVTQLRDPIAITIPRDDAGDLPKPDNFTIEEKTVKTHKLNVEDPSYSINAVIQPGAVNCSHDFEIFLRKNKKPTTEVFDFNWTIRVIPGEAERKDNFSLSVSNYQLNKSTSDTGVYYLGLYATLHDKSEKDEKCRSELNYTLFTFVSSCNFWDEKEEVWKASGCEVGPETTYSSTVCLCTHLTNFGGGFMVAPNPIDFDAAFKGFSDIASNPVVFATVLTIFGLYFVGVIWARWRDKKDLEKVGVTPLLSNDPRDTYGYEITLQTGFQQKSRTTADVFIQLIGTLGDSETRMLKDPKRPKFGRGEIDQFLLTVPQSLGSIKEIHIWHNNAGRSPAWYLFRVLIRDLQTDSKWWFVCDRWLAVEEGDGAVDRRLYLATKAELTKFNILFVNATRKNLLDGHLWLSVFTRPPKSTFTRVQRLSCCLSLMLSTMLANLMFYQVGADDNSTASQSIHIGPFIFSVKQIMIGVQSSFVVLPVNMIIVTIFRKLKPKEDNSKSKKYEEVGEEACSPSPTMDYRDSPVTAKSKPKSYDEDVTTSHPQMAQITSPEEIDNSKKKDFSWKTLVKIFKKDDDDDNGKKAKKKFLFPHWCIYIAYVLVAISSLTCGFFCMLYGFTFGKEKSTKWLTSMLVSFFQSTLVIQPFKVLLIAAFFALIIKDPNKEDEQEQDNAPDPALNVDEESIDADAEREPRKLGFQSKPPDAKKLEAARKLRLKQCEMKAIIKEIITHFLVVGVVLTVAYGNHDNRSFAMTEEVKNVLVNGDPNLISFDALNRKEVFWTWAIDNLIANLFPSSTSDEYPYMGIIKSGEVSNVLGVGRIRQIRIKKDTCKVPMIFTKYITECNDYYSWSEEETNDFDEGWLPENKSKLNENIKDTKPVSPWHYQNTLEARSFPYLGKMSSYRGGGFIVELGPDEVTADYELEKLETSSWIDRYTRALFTELSVYNVNVNLLCVATLLYEELPTGGGQTFVNVQTIRVYRYIGNFSAGLMACEVILAFLLLNWILRDGKRLWKERKAFWKNVWNIVDITVTSLSIASLVLYFMRMVFLNSAIGKVREDRSKFVSFQYVVLLNEGVNAMIAFVVLLLNLKFLRMLRFNRKISVLSNTIRTSASKLASFMTMFMVIFLAYCFLVYLVFGSALEEYRSFIRCMVSMMSMVLGNFEFYDLVAINRIIGPSVFFTFMVVFQFILINMFIGILCDSFNEVRNDADKQTNEYEIIQFISNRIKAFVGMFVEAPIRPEYNWPKTELEKKVETIEEKADTTMYFMRSLCDEDVRQMRWFQPELWSSKKSKVMSLVLNSDAEILENDLCDGIEAMNTIIEKYSENELDRMIATSRMKRRIGSEVASVMTGSIMSLKEESEKRYQDLTMEVPQDILDENVLRVQEMQGLQEDSKEKSEPSEEEADEQVEDVKEIEEEWEEELELLEQCLEDYPSQNESHNASGSFFMKSTLSLRGVAVTEMFKDARDATNSRGDDSIMKSVSSLESETSLESASSSRSENYKDTEGSIEELRSQLGEDETDDDVFLNTLPQNGELRGNVPNHSITAWTPESAIGNSTAILITDENMEDGLAVNEDLTTDESAVYVPHRKESEA